MSLRRRFRLDGSRGSTRRRLMHVTGHNIVTVGVPDKNSRYMSDLYTTLIDIQWRWNILIFTSAFVLTWLAFACLYFLVSYLHGDLVEPLQQPTGFVPCLDNVQTFTAAYLFSIETMTTIGYGSRGQTEECPGVYLAVMFQSILGAGLQFALATIVVSKTRKAKRWNILIFTSAFVLTWLAFACLYFLMSYLHGDLVEPLQQPTGFVPCLDNVQTFTAAYLFSIETMTTIGYGSRGQTEECPGVYLAVMFQSILGAGLQFALATIVVSKTRKAKRRCGTVLFSDLVCIYEQDAHLHMAVRVGDMRRSEIVGAHAQGFLVKKFKSKDGTFVPVRIFSVNFRSESGRDELFLSWPSQILHKVDEDSPLWTLSRDEMLSDQYELIVVIDGVSGATSQPFQARKSYHASEMRWGHRVKTVSSRFSCIELQLSGSGSYVMDLANFHHTVPASTPLCSAQDITTLRRMYSGPFQDDSDASGELDVESHLSSEIIPFAVNCAADSEIESTEPIPKPGTSRSKDMVTTVSMAYRKAVRSRRSVSVVENCLNTASKTTKENATENQPKKRRRCSLGDLIRHSQGVNGKSSVNSLPLNISDALNMYRHRRSVTDTYLGEEIKEEGEGSEEDSNQAILTIMSHVSSDEHIDVRDVFKKRRSSASQLFFSPEI
ncbi:hypothetical protein EGW08_019814 [Elysia chlorotica]|uniref:Uncharacterized protein n=1 Tax=Elysia chlorotica TaxID=188477 RepID=A0A433ST51_ELYCH|nr:hypothetical protein EGW08_019814 [Elysia chlorotica]